MMNGSITTLKTNHRSTVHREDGGNPIFSEMYRAQPNVLVNCTKVQPVCSVSYRFLCYLGDLCYLNDHPRSSTINTNVMNCGTSKNEYWNIKMHFKLIFFSSTLKIKHCQGTTGPTHWVIWLIQHLKFKTEDSTSYEILGEKYTEQLWQIQVTTSTNQCKNLEKSMNISILKNPKNNFSKIQNEEWVTD